MRQQRFLLSSSIPDLHELSGDAAGEAEASSKTDVRRSTPSLGTNIPAHWPQSHRNKPSKPRRREAQQACAVDEWSRAAEDTARPALHRLLSVDYAIEAVRKRQELHASPDWSPRALRVGAPSSRSRPAPLRRLAGEPTEAIDYPEGTWRELDVPLDEALSALREALATAGIREETLHQLIAASERRTYPRYADIMREGGKSGGCAFVLLRGCVEVRRSRGSVPKFLVSPARRRHSTAPPPHLRTLLPLAHLRPRAPRPTDLRGTE